MADIIIPQLFPFDGSGPAYDLRFDLMPYRSGHSARAADWRKLEDAVNWIYGRKRRQGPFVIVNRVVYAAGHVLDSLVPIYLDDDTTSLSISMEWLPVALDYDAEINESAGAGATAIVIPYGEATVPVLVSAHLAIATPGWTMLGLHGDAAAASHPTLKSLTWKVTRISKYK